MMNKIILNSELEVVEQFVDARTYERIKNGQIERFESLEDMFIISFDWYDIFNQHTQPAQLIICFSKENLLFICENKRLFDKVSSVFKEFTENEKILFHIFAELMKPDMDYLEKLEDEIAEVENNLIVNSKTKCAHSIVMFRKELIRLKKYYEQLNSIFEDILENENGILSHAHLRYFAVLDNRVDRLFSTVLNLREFVTQLREAYQAQIDIEQNAIMKIFTVITSIFLPLTLIVGWYGMNLQMPEFSWSYGYVAVITLSIAVCAGCVAFFKVKKWF